MTDERTIHAEARAILEWFAALEQECPPDRVLSRHYRSARITIYGRVSRFKPAVAGALSICLADLDARQPGQGLLTAVCELFSSASCPTLARVLFVENVVDSRLTRWLERHGFQRDPHSAWAMPSLYLDLRPPT